MDEALYSCLSRDLEQISGPLNVGSPHVVMSQVLGPEARGDVVHDRGAGDRRPEGRPILEVTYFEIDPELVERTGIRALPDQGTNLTLAILDQPAG